MTYLGGTRSQVKSSLIDRSLFDAISASVLTVGLDCRIDLCLEVGSKLRRFSSNTGNSGPILGWTGKRHRDCKEIPSLITGHFIILLVGPHPTGTILGWTGKRHRDCKEIPSLITGHFIYWKRHRDCKEIPSLITGHFISWLGPIQPALSLAGQESRRARTIGQETKKGTCNSNPKKLPPDNREGSAIYPAEDKTTSGGKKINIHPPISP
ncbi:hypothetical protein RRG08_064563 [Elysia crispata]|uniref:Uncharacterized protein n=1 Tax=Elysia crispata TaxID=231223 RepID=A0AAE1B8W7_9GAST|nr:hypothetical protein RRG08_064563 [Elysia crispata]